MSLCPSCGLELAHGETVCHHHVADVADGWSTSNRTWCNYFHRGTAIPRLPPHERDDNFWGHLSDG